MHTTVTAFDGVYLDISPQKEVVFTSHLMSGLSKWWLLLNNQTTTHMFSNPELFCPGSIVASKSKCKLHCNTGTTVIDKEGRPIRKYIFTHMREGVLQMSSPFQNHETNINLSIITAPMSLLCISLVGE
mmetsp:Transcript_35469/g.82301  ORF Transcript_35469/g.82301 Transcript_35469/m.82301 type:complete len:129 (+) Transcript_35469:1679-2065(+)